MNHDTSTNEQEGRALALAEEDQRGPQQSGESAARFSEKEKARFWKKVAIAGPDDCWEWQASRNGKGYGYVNIGGKVRKAHRVARMLANGEIPAGLLACHKCDNPPCCNPAHLFLGTHGDNARDKISKGRSNSPRGDANGARLHPQSRARGVVNGRAKLTAEQVVEIRALAKSGLFQREIATRYGVGETTIRNIFYRRKWTHIP